MMGRRPILLRLSMLLPMLAVCQPPSLSRQVLIDPEGTSRTQISLACPLGFESENVTTSIGPASDDSLDRSCLDVELGAGQQPAATAQSAAGRVDYSASFDLGPPDAFAVLRVRCHYDLSSPPAGGASCAGTVTGLLAWDMVELRSLSAELFARVTRTARGAEPVSSLGISSISLDCSPLGAPTSLSIGQITSYAGTLPQLATGSATCRVAIEFASVATTPGISLHEVLVELFVAADCRVDGDCAEAEFCVAGQCRSGGSGAPCSVGFYPGLDVASDCAATTPICSFGSCQDGRDGDPCSDTTLVPVDSSCDLDGGYACVLEGGTPLCRRP